MRSAAGIDLGTSITSYFNPNTCKDQALALDAAMCTSQVHIAIYRTCREQWGSVVLSRSYAKAAHSFAGDVVETYSFTGWFMAVLLSAKGLALCFA